MGRLLLVSGGSEGAARVVALDHYVWCTRLVEQQAQYRRSRDSGEPYRAPHLDASLWDPESLQVELALKSLAHDWVRA